MFTFISTLIVLGVPLLVAVTLYRSVVAFGEGFREGRR